MDRTKIIDCFARDPDGNGSFVVVAETKRGARFVLAGYIHRDEARVQQMADRIKAFGSVNLDLWIETYPRYASEAYMDEAEEAHLYATGLRAGLIGMDDIPEAFRNML